MYNDPSDPRYNLWPEIQKETAKIKRTRWWDHRLACSITWISILTSFIATISIAFQPNTHTPFLLIAILAGIPGLMIAIDKAFEFGKRASWGTSFEIELQKILDEIELTNTDTHELAKKYRELRKTFESNYFKIGFFSTKQE